MTQPEAGTIAHRRPVPAGRPVVGLLARMVPVSLGTVPILDRLAMTIVGTSGSPSRTAGFQLTGCDLGAAEPLSA